MNENCLKFSAEAVPASIPYLQIEIGGNSEHKFGRFEGD